MAAQSPSKTGHVQDNCSGLTYMQARYYDPVLGRFMQTDPIGYQDQLNLYAYVHNDPVNMVDPDGLCTGRLIDRSSFCVGGNSRPPTPAPPSNDTGENSGPGSSKSVQAPGPNKIGTNGASPAKLHKAQSNGQVVITPLGSPEYAFGLTPVEQYTLDPKSIGKLYIPGPDEIEAINTAVKSIQAGVPAGPLEPYENYSDAVTGARLPTRFGPYVKFEIPTPNAGNAGARRLIIGQGVIFYTNSHYRHFIAVD